MEFVDDAAALASLEAALADNAYYVKYREKLSALKASDPATYRRRLELMAKQAADAARPPAARPPPPRLDSGVDVAKLAQLDAAGVRALWRARFEHAPGCVAAAVDGATWRAIAAEAAASPVFLYPVPRDDAWALVVGEWRGAGTLQLTPLDVYQRRGAADAPVAAVLQHYTELLDSHGLALMLGGAPRGATGLDVRELQLVAQLVPHFHTTPGGVALLRRFNEGAAAAGSGEIHLEIIAAVQALAAPAAKPASAPAPAAAPAPAPA